MRSFTASTGPRRAALEMPARALPADAVRRSLPCAVGEPGLELARRHRPRRDGPPRASVVGGQDLDPRALDRAVEPREVSRVQPPRRDQVVEPQAREIPHGPAVLEGGHDDVIVAAGYQVGTRAVEPAPASAASRRTAMPAPIGAKKGYWLRAAPSGRKLAAISSASPRSRTASKGRNSACQVAGGDSNTPLDFPPAAPRRPSRANRRVTSARYPGARTLSSSTNTMTAPRAARIPASLAQV